MIKCVKKAVAVTGNVLLGNKALQKMFSEKIKNKTLSHAYLITGPEGSGKTSLVKQVIKMIFCTAQANRPCNVCSACKKVDTLAHPDLQILSKPNSEQAIKVSLVRNFLKGIELAPNEAPVRIYVIDNAESLRKESQNALLKTLEEPIGRTMFFLLATTDSALLPTVRSRCMSFPMEPIDEQTLVNHLVEKYKCDKEIAKKAYKLSGGFVGAAYDVIEQKGAFELRDETSSFLKLLAKGDKVQAVATLSSKSINKDKLVAYYNEIQLAMRDISARNYADEHPMYFLSREDREEIARKFSVAKAISFYDVLESEKNELLKNGNVQLSILRLIQSL